MSKQEHYQQGMEGFAEDRLEDAIRELQKALEIEPEYGDALHALSMCYYHHGEVDRAIEVGEKLRRLEPDDPLVYTSLSMFYNAKGMIEKAEEMGGKAKAAGFRESLREVKDEQES